MALRTVLVALIVLATAAFVVGVGIERGEEAGRHDEAAESVPEPGEAGAAEERGSEAEQAGEAGGGEGATEDEEQELRPLGINIEAWPFVTVAALSSLLLALAAWLRPRLVPLLWLTALVMLAFAALDIREVIYQADLDETGMAVLAGAVAVLHALAALVAGAMAARARRASVGGPGSARTMAA